MSEHPILDGLRRSMGYDPKDPRFPQRIVGLTAVIWDAEDEGGWTLDVDFEDGRLRGFERHGSTPGELLDWIMKWARDRALSVEFAPITFYTKSKFKR